MDIFVLILLEIKYTMCRKVLRVITCFLLYSAKYLYVFILFLHKLIRNKYYTYLCTYFRFFSPENKLRVVIISYIIMKSIVIPDLFVV